MMIFKYAVEYYCDFEKDLFVNRGYTVAENFTKAMENVVKHFGEEAIDTVLLTPVSSDSVIELKEDNIKNANIHTVWKSPMLNEGF